MKEWIAKRPYSNYCLSIDSCEIKTRRFLNIYVYD